VKDAGATGASTARIGGGAGSGQPTASSERDRRDRVSGHKAQLYLAFRQHRGSCEAGAGAVFAALHITALVAGTGSILHDSPERSEVEAGARGCDGSRGPRFLTSGRECAAPGRGSMVEGRAVRPSVEHGRPEVRLTLGAVVSAASSAEAQTRRNEHRSRSRSWPLSRRGGVWWPGALASCRGARGRDVLASGWSG